MIKSQAERRNMMSLIKRKVYESVINERADSEYVLKQFTCNDLGCSELKRRHHHAYNIDLKYLKILILKAIFLHH